MNRYELLCAALVILTLVGLSWPPTDPDYVYA